MAIFWNFFFFLNWRPITLQYCPCFCHTLTWISHGCTRVPHLEPPSHCPLSEILKEQNKTKTIPLSLLNQVFPASKCIWMEIRKRLRQKGLKETTPSPGFTREAVLWSLSQQFHLDVFLSKTRNDSSEIHHWKAEKQTITYGYVRSFLFV